MSDRFKPPYYAVIFISRLSSDSDGYAQTAARMLALAREMPGFLGFESARESIGISVSFWQDENSIANWKAHAEHQDAQESGRQRWYDYFELHVARVERFHTHGSNPPG